MTDLPASDVISAEVADHIATIWLDRPDQRNAMGPAFWTDFPATVEAVSADPDVRVIVVAARGPAFTVGIDLKAFGPILTSGSLDPEADTPSPVAERRATYQMIKRLQDTFTSMARAPQPVICAIHGWCIGGGMNLITAADIRYASADAMFSFRETKIAIVADVGAMQRMPRIVEPGRLAEIVYTGKDFAADEAREVGLVSSILPDQEATMAHASATAAAIAANSPLAVQGAKRILRNTDRMVIEDQLDYVALWNSAFVTSSDLTEAMMAFLEKRPPEFTGH